MALLRPWELQAGGKLRGNEDLGFLATKQLVWKLAVSLECNTISARTTAALTPAATG